MIKFTNAGPGRAKISNRNKALPTAIARRLALTQYAQRHPFKIPNVSKVQMHPAMPFPTDARSTAINAKSRTVKNQNPARVRTIFGRFAVISFPLAKFHAFWLINSPCADSPDGWLYQIPRNLPASLRLPNVWRICRESLAGSSANRTSCVL